MTEDRAMWGDEPLDEPLREAAARYHEPGAVPREAMWARIEAARAGRGAVTGREGAPRVLPLLPVPASRRIGRGWPRVAAGASPAPALA